MKLLITTPDH